MRTLSKRKTKIVATLGPASNSREVLREMIAAGMDVARLNFSHGTHDEHAEVLKLVREESEAAGRHVAVFQDLCGPKLRIGVLADGEITLEDNKSVELCYSKPGEDHPEGTAEKIYISIFNPGEVMRVGERALLADGRIELVAEDIGPMSVTCRIVAGGAVRSRSGIAVPESNLNLPCLTEKDMKDLAWGVENLVDYVALSFVGTSKDVAEAREAAITLGAEIPIIAKVERASSLDHITDIVSTSDAVMVARGDLGLELPIERVPGAQKLIINTANYSGVPVITATQMLMSMVEQIRPTRAEVTDVSTAVRDGTDAVMLSEETAVGKHPIQAIKVLARILVEAEKEQAFERERLRPSLRGKDRAKVADAICYAACSAAEKVSATAMIACTQSGKTAKLMSKYRPNEILFGATSQKKSLARMSLFWGVHPVFIQVAEGSSIEEEISEALITVREEFGVKPGSRIVVTAGLRTKTTGATNVMEIRDVPRSS